MALKRNETYPGRFSNPTADHPQGAFKNRSAPGAQDGSFCEQQWANDWDGFFARLLTVAGVTPNGNMDTGTSSQYYDALVKAITNSVGAPTIGIPFLWSQSVMPNTVMPEWADMVFLKFNGSSFSATTYPKLALGWPGLILPDTRGEFLRMWDDGRGVDAGRALLSAQLDALQNITGSFNVGDNNDNVGGVGVPAGVFSGTNNPGRVPVWTTGSAAGTRYITATFNAANVARTATETRPRNVAFNLLVRAK